MRMEVAVANVALQQAVRTAILELVAAGTSQNKLALRLEISAATVSQIANNQFALISAKMVNKLAAQLGVQDTWQIVRTKTCSASGTCAMMRRTTGGCWRWQPLRGLVRRRR